MKILRVSPALGKGGAEDIIVNLSNHEAHNNDVTLLLFKRSKDDSYNISLLDKRVKVITLLPSYLHSNLLFIIACYVFSPIIGFYTFLKLQIYKYDIVHTNMTAASFYSIIWQLINYSTLNKKTKFIETYHTNWHLTGNFQKAVFRTSWKLKDALVYEIHRDEKESLLKIGISESNIFYIPFGINPTEPNTTCMDNFKKQFIDTTKNKLSIMTISRLRLFEKKIDSMLLTCKHLLEMGIDFHFYICGDGKDKQKIEHIIESYCLTENVTLTGFIDDPVSISNLCDIYICAMAGDNSGISGLQAGLNGKAVVGIQTIENYKGQSEKIFFSSDAPEKIALFIKDLIETSHYDEYATACKNIVFTTYLASVMCSKYEDLYRYMKSSTSSQ